MERLLNMLGAVISPEQVLSRHYFLEVLNKPEYIWGIRAVGVMTAILTFFLYIKLKEAVNLAEAAAGSVEAAVDSTQDIAVDSTSASEVETMDLPILDMDLEPENDQVPELSSGLSSELETEQVSDSSSEQASTSDSDHMSEPEPVPVIIPITEQTSKQRTEIKPVRKSTASNVSERIAENNIWLWALLGISLGGLILYTYGRRRKKGKR